MHLMHCLDSLGLDREDRCCGTPDVGKMFSPTKFPSLTNPNTKVARDVPSLKFLSNRLAHKRVTPLFSD